MPRTRAHAQPPSPAAARMAARALAVAEAGRRLADAETEEALLGALFRAAAELVPLPHWWRNDFEAEGGTRTTHWTPGLTALFTEARITAPLRPDSIHADLDRRLRQERGTIFIPRCAEALPYLDPALDAQPLRTYLAIPMVHRDQIAGALLGGSFGAEGERALDPLDIQALELLVGSATQALLRIRAQRSLAESERQFRWFYERNLAGLFQTRATGEVLGCNLAFARLLGWEDPAELVGLNARTLYADPADRDTYLAELRRRGSVSGYPMRLRRRDGSLIWVLENVAWVEDPSGRGEDRLEGILIDVSDRMRSEEFERGQRELLALVARRRSLDEIFPAALDLLVRLHPHLEAGLHLPGKAGQVLGSATAGYEADPATVSACADGGRFVAEGRAWAWPVADLEGRVQGVLALRPPFARQPRAEERQAAETLAQVLALALEHEAISRRLVHQAHHDALTGLPNRVLLEDRLGLALAQARRHGTELALLVLDLDGFKVINDTLGHGAGDQLLQDVADRLARAIRASDTLARLGGDEFAVILHPVPGPQAAARVAEKLLACFQEPFRVDGVPHTVSASMGLAFCPQDGEDGATLLRHADAAMYRAKAKGKGNCQCYTPELQERLQERMELERRLRKALEDREFRLHYQPQFRPDGRLVGFEALLRWDHPELGMIPPSRFIPVAEECGLILPLGRWVLEEACAQMLRWRAAGAEDLRVAVNVSSIQFSDPGWVETVAQTLTRLGLPPACLELELTESLVMDPGSEAGTRLRRLQAMGIRLAVDDFGTGYSSLSYLHRLPVGLLKIDQSFVRAFQPGTGEREGALLQAIVALARSLGLQVVAEGVETPDQRDFLAELGCDALQGYLLGRPAPPEAFEGLLGRQVLGRPA